ncbi:MAG: radical SAM protein, partial [Rhodospirillales bacterium]|nr:radical SAM protein [Rhodospirillales bacterium]
TEGGLLGSIEEKRFKDFWFSEENRKNLFTFNPRVSCQHHCVTHSKNLALMEFLSLDQDHSHFV